MIAPARLWPAIRRRPFTAAWLTVLVAPTVLAIGIFTWDGLTWAGGKLATWTRSPTIAEQCEADVADARQRGLTPLNYDNELHRESYWAELLTTCVRHRIAGTR